MQLVHRVGLAVITTPVIVLPILARVQDYIPTVMSAGPPTGPVGTTLNTILLLISSALPLLLIWAEFFCISQTNGILRAGHWLRRVEEKIDLANPQDAMCGWESWIESGNRRAKDDILTMVTRLVLITVFYYAGVLLICFILRGYLLNYFVGLTSLLSTIATVITVLLYSGIFMGFLVLRKRALYGAKAK